MVSGEFTRIAQIEALLKRASNRVLLGIGDDCAVLAPSPYPQVWTTDAAVEEVHFSRSFMSLEQIGFRAFMAAASDVAAMGGRAVAALSALILPVAFSDEELHTLVRGIARAADACHCPVIGGNLARGRELSLTTSVLGECSKRVVTRSGARVGDGVYVTGALGGSALGLHALRAGRDGARFLAPRARLDVASQLAEVASAAIDISDGTLQDLSHLCASSGVGARLEVVALPLEAGALEAARALNVDAVELALNGGEDYELLFTSSQTPSWATRIGSIVAAGLEVVEPDGSLRALGHGFDHFAGS